MLLLIILTLFNRGAFGPDPRLNRDRYDLMQVIVEVEVAQAHQRHLDALWPWLRDLPQAQREIGGWVRHEAASETGLQLRIGNGPGV